MELVSRFPSGFLNFKVAPFCCVLSSDYGTCFMYGVGELFAGFCWVNVKGPPGGPGHRWQDNIKIYPTEIGWGRDWIDLARNWTSFRLICCTWADKHRKANSPFSQFCERAYKLSCKTMTCCFTAYSIYYYLEILPVSR